MNGVNHMNEKNRVFGNNVKLFISDKNLSEQTVAEHLGYSKYDLWKIMDGRLFLDEDENVILLRSCRLQLKIFICQGLRKSIMLQVV